jgi:predicted class III extradiol MEMO1 family dioxygenase
MPHVRHSAVAGAFYPGQRQALVTTIVGLLATARLQSGGAIAAPKALIVPHAGYVYSGLTAAAAYAQLAAVRSTVRRVVLLGPVHRVAVRGLALAGASAFDTPLGPINVDQTAEAMLAHLPQVVTSIAAHALEHSLEVQLPFLQTMLDDFKLVPLAVGDVTPAEVAEVLEALWGGPETLIAQAIDQDTVEHILNLDGPLTHEQACGGTPISGLLLAARRHHLHPRLLHLCNSGDTAGDRQRVVGYTSIAFLETPNAIQ